MGSMSALSGLEGTTAAADLRRLLDVLPDAALVVDRAGTLVLVNEQAGQVFGYPTEELVGRSARVLLMTEGARRLTRVAGDPGTAPTGQRESLELHGRRQDGSRFLIEAGARAIDTEHDVLVLCVVRDLTCRVGDCRACLNDSQRTASEAQLLMAALVDSAHLGIVSATMDGVIASWNGGAEAVLGYGEKEMVGTSFRRLLPSSPDDEVAQLVARLEEGEPLASFDVVLPHRDGRELHLAMTASPILDRRQRMIGHSLVFHDITSRVRIEAALARAKDEAERTSTDFEAFSYAVAHDLRAPLRAIDGFSQALLEDYPDVLDEVGHGYIAEMRSSARYMSRLIDSLLELARLTQGPIALGPVDLSELARSTIRRLRLTEPDRGVEVVIEDGVHARGNAAMLGIVLDNLLGNAWKYTRPREHARIEFGSTRDGTGTAYVVRDNGVGFDVAYSDKLFGVFQRLHAVEAFEGVGIGLATVKKVVQRHGGTIWAHGEVDRGATFSFTLAAPPPAPGDSAPSAIRTT
jgi:PAS domain S-box-containing protein